MRFANNPVMSRRPKLDPALSGGRPGSFRVELVEARAMIALERAWSDLTARSLEPDVFFDPSFLLPLLQHGGFAGDSVFLLAWDNGRAGLRARLAGLLPTRKPRRIAPFSTGSMVFEACVALARLNSWRRRAVVLHETRFGKAADGTRDAEA